MPNYRPFALPVKRSPTTEASTGITHGKESLVSVAAECNTRKGDHSERPWLCHHPLRRFVLPSNGDWCQAELVSVNSVLSLAYIMQLVQQCAMDVPFSLHDSGIATSVPNWVESERPTFYQKPCRLLLEVVPYPGRIHRIFLVANYV